MQSKQSKSSSLAVSVMLLLCSCSGQVASERSEKSGPDKLDASKNGSAVTSNATIASSGDVQSNKASAADVAKSANVGVSWSVLPDFAALSPVEMSSKWQMLNEHKNALKGWSDTYSYTLDSAGRVVGMQISGGVKYSFSWNDQNLVTLASQGSTSYSYTYDNQNRLLTMTTGPNKYEYQYQNGGKFISIQLNGVAFQQVDLSKNTLKTYDCPATQGSAFKCSATDYSVTTYAFMDFIPDVRLMSALYYEPYILSSLHLSVFRSGVVTVGRIGKIKHYGANNSYSESSDSGTCKVVDSHSLSCTTDEVGLYPAPGSGISSEIAIAETFTIIKDSLFGLPVYRIQPLDLQYSYLAQSSGTCHEVTTLNSLYRPTKISTTCSGANSEAGTWTLNYGADNYLPTEITFASMNGTIMSDSIFTYK